MRFIAKCLTEGPHALFPETGTRAGKKANIQNGFSAKAASMRSVLLHSTYNTNGQFAAAFTPETHQNAMSKMFVKLV
ncbi:MAG: hypothetical protein K2X60_11270 [Xanthobacteraceae bacterium]|nr:hypothetical protein [Xanthobacteraceae bacterium]